MSSTLSWIAAAASLLGLFFTLSPAPEALSLTQSIVVVTVILVFGLAAFNDLRDEWRRRAKRYPNTKTISDYMFKMLKDSGRCDVCSRDASWIADKRIFSLLETKAKRGELSFVVQKITPALNDLKSLGAEVREYGTLGLDAVTRFTVANSGNPASSYVAIGHQQPNASHTIEEFGANHPTYLLAVDLIRSLKAAHDQHQKA